MLEDIREQPQILEELINRYFPEENGVSGINFNAADIYIKNISKIYIVASGSSRNAGNIAKYFIEKVTSIPTEADFASEFAHRNPCLNATDVVVAISQSGETADTFAAMKVAQSKSAHTVAITNNPDSKIHKLADTALEVGAGKEQSIAATKSFTAQLLNIYAFALKIAEIKGSLSPEEIEHYKNELRQMPQYISSQIDDYGKIESVAGAISEQKSLVILGRGINYGTAQEAALKIKETSYIDANGYPTGEFLHGYVAVLDENAPIISLIPGDNKSAGNYKLALSNTEEIKKKRNPNLIIAKSQNNAEIEKNLLFNGADFLNIPDGPEWVSPFYLTVCVQMLALATANALGRDVNNPRALTKAITNE